MKRHGEPGPFDKFHNLEKNLFRWAIVGIVAAFVSLLVFSFSDSDDISKPIDSASESIPASAQDSPQNEGDGDATSQTKTVIMGQKYVEDGVEKEKQFSVVLEDKNGDGEYEVKSQEELLINSLETRN